MGKEDKWMAPATQALLRVFQQRYWWPCSAKCTHATSDAEPSERCRFGSCLSGARRSSRQRPQLTEKSAKIGFFPTANRILKYSVGLIVSGRCVEYAGNGCWSTRPSDRR